MIEEWRGIPGWKNFEASSMGHIRNRNGRIPSIHIDKYGYRQTHLSGKTKRIGRLIASAFLANFSAELFVDHINGDRADDRISNLRMVTRRQNQSNMKMHKDNPLGIKGVDRIPNGKFRAKIYAGRVIYLGVFKNIADAAAAYAAASLEYHGEYGRLA